LLINNDLDGIEYVVTDTVLGLVSSAPITLAPRPGNCRLEPYRPPTHSPIAAVCCSNST
jgi:hypothetical protein